MTVGYTLSDGYLFDNWSGDFTTATFNMPANNATMTANAKIIPYSITYNGVENCTFESANPTSFDVTSATINLKNPNKNGYEFTGWTGSNGNTPQTAVSINTGSTENREYTAHWSINSYNITLNLNEGTIESANPIQYNVTSNDFDLPTPNKDYYTFLGWTGEGTATPQKPLTISNGTTGDKNYTANYRPSTYTISLDAKGGIVEYTTKEYNIETAEFTLPQPTRTNYAFVGWVTGGGDPVKTVTIVTGSHGDKSYVASWTLADVIAFKLSDSVVLELRKCPAGTFTMGSPESEVGHFPEEKQQHSVTISNDYWMGTYEVTQAQHKAIMGSNPSYNTTEDEDVLPVEQVSWNDIMTDSIGFIAKLNAYLTETNQLPANYKFDLPTEAQWEYACRAGTETSLNNGTNIVNTSSEDTNLNAVAWYKQNWGSSNNKTHTVGALASNTYGLYDMHGNVFEWCKDMYADYPTTAVTDPFCDSGSNPVIRGGSWYNNPNRCRSAFRASSDPSITYSDLGFRLALVPSPVQP